MHVYNKYTGNYEELDVKKSIERARKKCEEVQYKRRIEIEIKAFREGAPFHDIVQAGHKTNRNS